MSDSGADLADAAAGVWASAIGERFPDEVIVALHDRGSTMTGLPVQFDDREDWQAAFFYVLAPEAACLAQPGGLTAGPFAVSIELDLHEHDKGTVIEIGLEIDTPPEPVHGITLFLTGHSQGHFETLELLATQSSLPLIIGDSFCRTLSRQRIPLQDEHRVALNAQITEAVGRDAIIRLGGRYHPEAAFADVVALRVG